MGCSEPNPSPPPPPFDGVGAPNQCPLGNVAMLLSRYTDVRSILMVFIGIPKAVGLHTILTNTAPYCTILYDVITTFKRPWDYILF